MSSQSEASEPSSLNGNSRNREFALFFPFLFGFTNTDPVQDSQSPHQGTGNSAGPDEYTDRIIFINPLTQGMVVIEGNNFSSGLNPLFRDLMLNKDGQPPASKASIEAMPNVEIHCGEECVICLEEYEVGGVAKEMPCQHKFHGDCIEKWLKIHGTCPVCRYKMPVEEDEDVIKKNAGENNTGRRREIWVSFTFGSDRRSGENNRTNHEIEV